MLTGEDFYLARIDLISEYIKKELGGTIQFTEERDLNLVKIRWRTFIQGGKEEITFQESITYKELETIVDPLIIAKRFVDHFERWRKFHD